MLTKLCKCGKRIKQNKKCCKDCLENKPQVKQYHTKEHRNFYSGARWTKLSKTVRNKYLIDLYLYHTLGIMKKAEIVHHIIPVKDDPTKAYDVDNLIPVTQASHHEIEKIYNLGGRRKKDLQKQLFNILSKQREGRENT